MTDLHARLEAALADRYAIDREIGRGGMATVFLADDLAHDRKVALKVLHPQIAASLGTDRFLREIRIAANLDHPYIVPLFASGEADGLLYYVMPFIDGETLGDRLEREGRLPVDEAVRIATDVAEGLEYAHGTGVVHRDIKPANILLSAGRARIADFGVARAIDAASGHQMTVTGLAVGTPRYMSPEQATGSGDVDQRSDIYSLGCVLWESLAGESPFDGPSAQAILARKLTDRPGDSKAIRRTVPTGLAAVLERALETSPEDRYPTAKAFSEALASPGAGLRYRGRRLLRAGATVLVAAGLTVGGAWLTTVFSAGASSSDPAAAAPGLEPNRLAVAPFRVFDPALQDWSEGVVDYLSRSLDNAGALRTVSPSTSVQLWSGRPDVASANELGRGSGAGLVVFGSLLGLGADSVRVDATIVDVVAGAAFADLEIRGPADRLDHVVDSLAVEILREVQTVRQIGTVAHTSIGARSMPALKAFLQGEQSFRRMALDSAVLQFERAVELDSTFALAHLRLGTSHFFRAVGDDHRVHIWKAADLNTGLSNHDSLIIVTASSIAGYGSDSLTGDQLALRARDAADAAVAQYPNDPEAWFWLGNVRAFMQGSLSEVTVNSTANAYARAIAEDSTYMPAYLRGFGPALNAGRVDEIRVWTRKYLSLNPPDWSRGVPLILDLLLDPEPDEARIDHVLDSVAPRELWKAWTDLWLGTDPSEIAILLTRRTLERQDDPSSWIFQKGARRRNLATALGYRGHIAEAAELAGTDDVGNSWFPELLGELAMLGGYPEATLDSTFRAWIEHEGSVGWSAWWFAERGDTAALNLVAEQLPERTDIRGALALARADTAAFLETMADHEPGLGYRELHEAVLQHARVLSAVGRDSAAYDLLDRRKSDGWPHPSHVTWKLMRARLAEKLGHLDIALRDYRYVARAWVHADDSLQPLVEEAQQASFRLGG
jgi:serine/threonine-protein kinase